MAERAAAEERLDPESVQSEGVGSQNGAADDIQEPEPSLEDAEAITLFEEDRLTGMHQMRLMWSMSVVLNWMLPTRFGFTSVEATEIMDVMVGFSKVANWSFTANIGGMILVTRVFSCQNAVLPAGWADSMMTWDVLLTVALLIAQKILDDVPLSNCQFPLMRQIVLPQHTYPKLELKDLNHLEMWFISSLEFCIELPTRVLTQFYLELNKLTAALPDDYARLLEQEEQQQETMDLTIFELDSSLGLLDTVAMTETQAVVQTRMVAPSPVQSGATEGRGSR